MNIYLYLLKLAFLTKEWTPMFYENLFYDGTSSALAILFEKTLEKSGLR